MEIKFKGHITPSKILEQHSPCNTHRTTKSFLVPGFIKNSRSHNSFLKSNRTCNMQIYTLWSSLYWVIIYGFMSRSRIFYLYEDITITGEGLQNLGLCSALRAFEQRGIFIVLHLLWHGTSVLPVSSEGPPHSVASYDKQGDVEDLF
jgi:hypothetical protein